MAKKIVLSHSGLARVASGVPISQVEHEEVEEEVMPETRAAVEPIITQAEPVAGLETPAADTAPAAPAETVPEMVAFLKSELSEARAELATLAAGKVQLEANLVEAGANSEGLMKAALHGAGLLQVMLGQTPVSLEGLPASTVTAQYSKYRQAYEARYVVGQQSLDSDEATTTEPSGVEAALKIGLRPVG
jgi:hypothetical protein